MKKIEIPDFISKNEKHITDKVCHLNSIFENPIEKINDRIGDCVPYSQLTAEEKLLYIEPGVRQLVDVLNNFDGIDTFGSCEGHEEPEAYDLPNEGYVAFTSTNEKSLKYILNKITHFNLEFTINGEKEVKHTISVSCDVSFNELYNNQIHYAIRCKASRAEFIHRYFDELSRSIKNNCVVDFNNILN